MRLLHNQLKVICGAFDFDFIAISSCLTVRYRVEITSIKTVVCTLTAGVLHFSSVSLASTSLHSSPPTVTVAFSLKPKPFTVSSVPPERGIKEDDG